MSRPFVERCRPFVLVAVVGLAPACSSRSSAATSSVTDAGASADGGAADVGVAGGHSLRVDVVLSADADAGANLTFLTPALSLFTMPAADVAGKPYYAATFPGGFDQGVDLDLHHEWGVVPDDLHVRYVTPPKFLDGPYDVAFIVYTKTEITQAIRDDFFTVAPKAGELSAFTLSHDRIRPGDPSFGNGVVRVNVEGADGTVELRNRHSSNGGLSPLTDTVLTVP
jgi:hypothetical protein